MKKTIPKFTIIFLFILLLLNRQDVKYAILDGYNIWLNQLLPTLFPFFIFSDLFVSGGIADDICKKLGPLFAKIFNTSKYSFFIFLVSLTSGSPTNSKLIKNMLDNGYILKEEAEKILCFTCFYNPFLIYSIASLYLHSNDAIKIITITYLSNIIVGLILRYKKVKINNLVKEKKEKLTIVDSIKNSIFSLFSILGTIIAMLVLITLLKTNNLCFNNILNGFIEITSGLINLNFINIPYAFKIFLTTVYLSFGGLSIHIQIKSILKDAISYKLFYQTRMLSIIISYLLGICIT